MTYGHISFENLSKYFDNTILSPGEKEAISSHLRDCPECAAEYGRLTRMVGMVSQLKRFGAGIGNEFTESTISMIRGGRKTEISRAGKNRIFVPAAAAAAVIIAVFAYLYSPVFKPDRGVHEISSGKNADYETDNDKRVLYSSYETARTLMILNNHDVRVMNISDSYIEGEVRAYELNRLKKEIYSRSHPYGDQGRTTRCRTRRNTGALPMTRQ
jgi:hypothetical protein